MELGAGRFLSSDQLMFAVVNRCALSVPTYGGRNEPSGGGAATTVSTAALWSCGLLPANGWLIVETSDDPGCSTSGFNGDTPKATFSAGSYCVVDIVSSYPWRVLP